MKPLIKFAIIFCIIISNVLCKETPIEVLGQLYNNNHIINQYLMDVLKLPYFRFFKIDLDKKCPFWEEPLRCFNEYCSVEFLSEEQVPISLFQNKSSLSDVEFPQFIKVQKYYFRI